MTIRELIILVEKYNISKDKTICFVHIDENNPCQHINTFSVTNIDENNNNVILDDCVIRNKLIL